MSTKYRADIDGLRTIAVMSVVLYHVGISSFAGGYVGVDVFFVISGFLITRLIVDEVEASGSFSFANFYLRRARRLFPAMLSTFLFSFVAAYLLFSPEAMERFAGSLVYALLSLSNFFFWWESGYFDADAHTKPLLHTWSLSVEEQFYLIWPALLSLVLIKFGRKAGLICVALIAVLSLAFAEYQISVDQAGAFFLLPARGVELAIGGLMVWIVRFQPSNKMVLEPILIAGLAMIVVPIFTFTPETRFPGVNALLPCIGTALAIYAGTARYSGLLLRNKPAVLIGKASYSIYLVHWPLFVFYSAFVFVDLSMTEKLGLAVMSVVLGWLQYRFVEERFRHGDAPGSLTRPAYAFACAALALLVMLPASTVWATGGARWRIDSARVLDTNTNIRNRETATYCRSNSNTFPSAIFTCQNFRRKSQTIFGGIVTHSI